MAEQYIVGLAMGQSVVVPIGDDQAAMYTRMGVPVYAIREAAEEVISAATKEAQAMSAASREAQGRATNVSRPFDRDAQRFWRD